MTSVNKLHTEFFNLLQFLNDREEYNFHNFADGCFRKLLLIAAASDFEKRLTDVVFQFSEETLVKDHLLVFFIKNKGIIRQYHTWFDWESKNANRFFSLFGDDFKKYMEKLTKSDREFSLSINAFMEIGAERNRIIHQDFINFPMEKTTEEIYKLYLSANGFIEQFPNIMREYSKS